MDRKSLVSLDRAALVDGVAGHVEDTTQAGRADGNGDGSTSIAGLGATNQTFRSVHSNATHDILSKLFHKSKVSKVSGGGRLGATAAASKLQTCEAKEVETVQ